MLDDYLSNENYGKKSDNYQYAFIDFDSDQISEIIFCYGYGIAIVHYENNILYGYDKIDKISNLKLDGTFNGRTDDNYDAIVTLSFNKSTYNKKIISYRYSSDYFIYGRNVSLDEYNEFLDKQNQKAGLEYTYVYNNEEYNSTEFGKINDTLDEDKNEYKEKIFKVLELYNGPGYGSGVSFCGDVNFDKSIVKENYDHYYFSTNYKSITELYTYWRDFLSDDFLHQNNNKFIEQDDKLYCYGSGKDGGSIYNRETSKFTIKNAEEDKLTIIGRIFLKDALGYDEYDENSYLDVVFKFTKNDSGNFVVNDFIRFFNMNNN